MTKNIFDFTVHFQLDECLLLIYYLDKRLGFTCM